MPYFLILVSLVLSFSQHAHSEPEVYAKYASDVLKLDPQEAKAFVQTVVARPDAQAYFDRYQASFDQAFRLPTAFVPGMGMSLMTARSHAENEANSEKALELVSYRQGVIDYVFKDTSRGGLGMGESPFLANEMISKLADSTRFYRDPAAANAALTVHRRAWGHSGSLSMTRQERLDFALEFSSAPEGADRLSRLQRGYELAGRLDPGASRKQANDLARSWMNKDNHATFLVEISAGYGYGKRHYHLSPTEALRLATWVGEGSDSGQRLADLIEATYLARSLTDSTGEKLGDGGVLEFAKGAAGRENFRRYMDGYRAATDLATKTFTADGKQLLSLNDLMKFAEEAGSSTNSTIFLERARLAWNHAGHVGLTGPERFAYTQSLLSLPNFTSHLAGQRRLYDFAKASTSTRGLGMDSTQARTFAEERKSIPDPAGYVQRYQAGLAFLHSTGAQGTITMAEITGPTNGPRYLNWLKQSFDHALRQFPVQDQRPRNLALAFAIETADALNALPSAEHESALNARYARFSNEVWDHQPRVAGKTPNRCERNWAELVMPIAAGLALPAIGVLYYGLHGNHPTKEEPKDGPEALEATLQQIGKTRAGSSRDIALVKFVNDKAAVLSPHNIVSIAKMSYAAKVRDEILTNFSRSQQTRLSVKDVVYVARAARDTDEKDSILAGFCQGQRIRLTPSEVISLANNVFGSRNRDNLLLEYASSEGNRLTSAELRQLADRAISSESVQTLRDQAATRP